MTYSIHKKRVLSLVGLILLATVLLLAVSACGASGDNIGAETDTPDIKVLRIEADAASSSLEGYAGEYDASRIRLVVYYSDGNLEIVNASNGNIAAEDRNKLNKAGTHQLKIYYSGCQTTVTVRLAEKPKAYYTLTVTDGVPVKINGVNLSVPVQYDGVRFIQSYEEGTEVTLEWVAKAGYYFNKWTDNGEDVDSQRTTEVVMNENHIYVAHSEPVVNTLTFVTNCDDGIPTRATNVLNESEIPALEKDGYVFDGWTTTAVVGDEAINCSADKITFPYTVALETTLYGTWRELGLEYEDYVTSAGTKGYRILDYVRNDKEIIIPEKHNTKPIVAISSDAFLQATALEKLYIPSTVEVIETGFVRNCARLKEITVDSSSVYFSDDEGILFNTTGDELIAYPAGLLNATYEPDGIKIIKDYAFYNAVIGGIVLPSSVSKIGDYALNSVHLDYVNLLALNPNEAGFSLGNHLFNDNTNTLLVNAAFRSIFKDMDAFVGLEDKITDDINVLPTIGINSFGTLIYRNIFNENSENAITTNEIIGADRSLESLVLPDILDGYVVSSIGKSAFNGCMYLSSFSIPKESGLERIMEDAFLGTPYQAKRLAADGSIIANDILYKYLGNDSSYTLPDDIVTIAEGAFRNNKSLQYIVLSGNNALVHIGPYAFYGCSAFLGSITRVYDNAIRLKQRVSTIGNYAFAESGLRAMVLASEGSSLTSIGKGAFRDCHYLTEVEIGPRTVEISNDAFLYCYSLQKYTVRGENPNFISYGGVLYAKSVNSAVYDMLFAYPSGKLSVEFNVNEPTLSDGLEVSSIGDYALFYANILSLYIPDSVKNISAYAIYVPGLVSVRFESINQGITYDDMFVKTNEELRIEKWEPEYVTVLDTSSESSERSIDVFFGNNTDLRMSKYVADGRTVFVSSDDGTMVFRLYDDYASVARYIRNGTSATIPEVIDGNNVTVVDEYAFTGYYLEQLTLGRYISKLSSHSLSDTSSLKILVTDDSSIPDIYQDTFSDAFNNGLFILIDIDRESAYQTKWNADERYLIDKDYEEPKVTFTYYPGEDADPIEPLYGVISSDEVPVPTREGYMFVGWVNANGDFIDFSTGYVPPYNIVLYCVWQAMEYKVTFTIGDTATMESTETTVEFGESYSFEMPIYANNSKELIYWRTSGGVTIEPSGIWTYLSSSETIVLFPVWRDVEFILLYNTEDGAVIVSDSRKIVFYGQSYDLLIPEKDGYVFTGWALDASGETILTDDQGKSLLPWQYNESTEYEVFAQWNVNTNIKVSLFFNKEEIYEEIIVVYGEPFVFEYDINKITKDIWIEKADIFCGWYDEYDEDTESGTGRRYTDENGIGLFNWDRGEEVTLYAQWPMVISSGEELQNLSTENMSRSIVLDRDIVVTEPIGDARTPYTGTFNGRGHTITFTYNSESDGGFDGCVGLFAYNQGTIKNFVLNASITIVGTSVLANDTIFIGSIAGKNEGKISSESNAVTAELSISIDNNVTKAHIGGLVGYNDGGTIEGVGMELSPLSISVNGTAYEANLHRQVVSCGLLIGTMNGGSAKNNSCTFIYHASGEDDPFRTVKCGTNLLSSEIDIAVSIVNS